ncbi:hypothetical protein [Cupriavidus sp. L7L]|uniref:hypothetical protein n=1 Tax=Cupriavidus sp. L7L TaxID=2546443 RepID=UPI00140472F1|nr:hypothetical protein [Cupriavidus sp. L7L]
MSSELFRPGTALPPLDKGTLTSSHIVRWCAAQENWDKIHYDRSYARNVAGLPDTVINGALKQQFLFQLATQAFGEGSWLWRLTCRFRGPDLVGQRPRGEGKIRTVDYQANVTALHLDLHLFNVDIGSATTEGSAVVLLPVSDADNPHELPSRYIEPAASQTTDVTPRGLDENVPASIRRHIGTEIEHIDSFNTVEAGRLRLFADAVMGRPRITMTCTPRAAVSMVAWSLPFIPAARDVLRHARTRHRANCTRTGGGMRSRPCVRQTLRFAAPGIA